MTQTNNWDQKIERFTEYLLTEERDQAVSAVTEYMKSGHSPLIFFEECINPALEKVGDKFESLEIFLPEMIVAAEIVQHISEEIVKPYIFQNSGTGMKSNGKVLLATVQGDLHDIGKNMVGLMLQVNGFEVIDAGIDVPPAEIITQARQSEVDIIGMSSLLTTCLPYMNDVFNILEDMSLRDEYKLIIGGAAPDLEFSEKVGADGFGHSAAEAVKLCKQLMSNS